MNIKASFFLASTSIKRGSKGIMIMTIFIMALAYINIVFITSIFGGIIEGIEKEAINNQFGNIVITPKVDEKYIKNDAIKWIDTIPGIIGSSARYIDNAIISYDELNDGKDIKSGNWPVKSIDVPNEKKVTYIHESIIEGSFLEPTDRDKILIGRDIAGGHNGSMEEQSLGGVFVGDKIDVQYSNGIKRTYKIKGIFSVKGMQAAQMVYITKKEMESVLKSVYNEASEIIVRIDNIGEEDVFITQIRQLGFQDEDIKRWDELMGSTESASDSFGMISLILGVIGTFVAGITIFIIIFVSIVNKRAQIGILKAIGMRESTIILSFVIQALFYGIAGILIGISFMLFVLRPLLLAYPLDFPMGWVSLKITANTIRVSNISLFIASLIGGIIPAYSGVKKEILKLIQG